MGERTEVLSWKNALATEAQLSIVELYKYDLDRFGTRTWNEDVLLSLRSHLLFADPKAFRLVGNGFGLKVIGFSNKRVALITGGDVIWTHRVPSVTFVELRQTPPLPGFQQDALRYQAAKVAGRISLMNEVETALNPITHSLKKDAFSNFQQFVDGAPLEILLAERDRVG